MSLDERIRAELARVVGRQGLDEDDALDRVRSTHHRGDTRRRVARQATAVAVVITLFAGVGLFLAWRAVPDRFRTTATVRIAAVARPNVTTTTDPLAAKFADPLKLALAASTEQAALVAAHLPADSRVDFRVTTPGAGLLALAATAPTAEASKSVTLKWFSALATARRADAVRRIAAARQAMSREITRLHDELLNVDRALLRLDPVTFRNIPEYDAPLGSQRGNGAPKAPVVPESASAREHDLYNERLQLLQQLAHAGGDSARLQITAVEPEIVQQLVTLTPPARIDRMPAATVPTLAGWLAALVLVLAGAVLAFRTRTRRLHQAHAVAAVAAVITVLAGVCLFLAWRAAPGRYRSTATVRIAAPARPNVTTTTLPSSAKLTDPLELALAPSTEQNARTAAHLPADRIDFRATTAGSGLLALAVSAPTADESAAVARDWASAFASARRADVRQQILAGTRALAGRVTKTWSELRSVDLKLIQVDPAVYRDVIRTDRAGPISRPLPPKNLRPPPAPENAGVYELNLANERIQLLGQYTELGAESARLEISAVTPAVFAVTMTPPTRIERTRSATVAALAAGLAGLLLGLAGAVLAFRIRSRTSRQVAA